MSAAARSCNCTLLPVSCAAQLARAAALACGIACFGPAEVLQAATLVSPGARAPIRISPEPFGLLTSVVTDGELKDKWLSLERKLDDERVQPALCEADRDRCASPAAPRRPGPMAKQFGRPTALDAGQRRRIAERYAASEAMAELARE